MFFLLEIILCVDLCAVCKHSNIFLFFFFANTTAPAVEIAAKQVNATSQPEAVQSDQEKQKGKPCHMGVRLSKVCHLLHEL